MAYFTGLIEVLTCIVHWKCLSSVDRYYIIYMSFQKWLIIHSCVFCPTLKWVHILCIYDFGIEFVLGTKLHNREWHVWSNPKPWDLKNKINVSVFFAERCTRLFLELYTPTKFVLCSDILTHENSVSIRLAWFVGSRI